MGEYSNIMGIYFYCRLNKELKKGPNHDSLLFHSGGRTCEWHIKLVF